MIRCGNWPVGLCSWSLKTDLNRLNEIRRRTGVDWTHLHLNPFLCGTAGYSVNDLLRDGWTLSATMVGFEQENYSSLETIRQTGGIVSDAYWPQNRAMLIKAIEKTAELGVPYLEFHFGFIELADPNYAQKLLSRARELADIAQKNNLTILLETGQETAAILRLFLEKLDHPSLGVNFDPANMILYGKGNPIEAVGVLGRWIRHVHIKDANASPVPGQWGAEVPWSTGQVNPPLFLNALKKAGFSGVLSIEREAGSERLNDIESAAHQLCKFQM